MRIKVTYEFSVLDSAAQALVKDSIMPMVLRIIDKYILVKQPETSNLLVSSAFKTNKCLFANVDADTISGGCRGAAAGATGWLTSSAPSAQNRRLQQHDEAPS